MSLTKFAGLFASALVLASCAKNGDAPSTKAPVVATTATNGKALPACSAAQVSDYRNAIKPCLSLESADACRDSVRSFFSANAGVDCVGDNVELRAGPEDVSLDDLLSSPIASDSSQGLCGDLLERDYNANVTQNCASSDNSLDKAVCLAGVSNFLKLYPNADCHPEAARVGEPVRAWRLRALVN